MTGATCCLACVADAAYRVVVVVVAAVAAGCGSVRCARGSVWTHALITTTIVIAAITRKVLTLFFIDFLALKSSSLAFVASSTGDANTGTILT